MHAFLYDPEDENRICAQLDIDSNEKTTWHLDDPSMVPVIFEENPIETDEIPDLRDYKYDPDTGEVVHDPLEPPPIEYVDLETGETQTMTSEDIDALVSEKVKNQVEAVLAEMIEADKVDLVIPNVQS